MRTWRRSPYDEGGPAQRPGWEPTRRMSMVAAVALSLIVMSMLVAMSNGARSGWTSLALMPSLFMGIGMIVYHVYRWITLPPDPRRGPGLCPECGYALAGIEEGKRRVRCPECGSLLEALREHEV